MPLKLHCIFNQPSVLPDIIKLVEKTAHKLNSKKKSAKVEDVYNELRDTGIEIDAESVAFAYQNTTGMIGRKNFSSKADLNSFGSAGMKAAIEMANKGDIIKARLGKLSISGAVARGIATTFSNLNNRTDIDKSRLFSLQEMLKKAANSMLDKSGYTKKPAATFTETLQDLFDAENVAKTVSEAMNGKVKGAISTIDEVWDAVKKDIDTLAAGIKGKAERAKFEAMTDAIKKSSYDLLLSTKQSDDVIKGILKGIGYTKEVNTKSGKVQVVDWNQVLANQDDWKNEFANALRNKGFTNSQTGRIISKLESNFEATIERKAQSKLDEIKKKNNVTTKSDPDALKRAIRLKNAGLFLPKNRDYLREAFGTDIPDDVADQIRTILYDYEQNTKDIGNISNVYTEEVVSALRKLLSSLGTSKMEQVVNGFSDYMGLRASSTISTIFNSIQNITSGMNAAFLPTISAVVKTKNPRLILRFMRSWLSAFRDVSLGGVTIRDAKTINVLEQLQGRGGLSDRWTFDNAKGFFGYIRAVANMVGQITATAADAANGTVIYNAEIVKSVKDILKQRGMTGAEANRAIDDIIFGRHQSGKTNRQVWFEKAKDMLENQEGVANKNSKAGRIADELVWHKLVTEFGLTIDEVKAIQSASLEQKSRNLGHQADIIANPALAVSLVSGALQKEANEAKKKGDRNKFVLLHLTDTFFRSINMFLGGKANWAVLALQNSPVGVAQGVVDILLKEISAKKGEIPLYRQELAIGNPDHLRDQLASRKAIYGRLERGVYGSVIQALSTWGLIALLDSGGGDDDEKRSERLARIFGRLMSDPNTKRFVDKAAPQMLAAELAYAFDPKANELNEEKLSNSPFLPKYLQSKSDFVGFAKDQLIQVSSMDKLKEAFFYNKKIKDEDERANANTEAVYRFLGTIFQLPYTSQFKIISNEVKVIASGFEPDDEQKEKNSQAFKERMESIDGAMDAFLDGAEISTVINWFK